MTTVAPQDINAAWETESGLIDDVDGYIVNPHFGFKEEYAQAVQASGTPGGAMFIVDVMSPEGELLGSQGYSIGTGWEISEDGRYITHLKRSNVVTSTLYGQLQNKVIKDLNVPMGGRGEPTDAMAWDGLGFHWNQLPHATVGGEEKTGLMPTLFIGELKDAPAPGAAPPAAAAPRETAASKLKAKAAALKAPAVVSPARVEALKLVGESADSKEFLLKAVKNAVIVNDDALMAEVMDDSATGFFAQNKA